MSKPVLRPATAEDEAVVVALWQVCNLTVSYNDPATDFRFALGKPASDILIAEQDGRIVGSVMVGHDGHRGWVYYVAAHPEFRKQGIGQMMVEAAESWLKERGVRKLMLLVRNTNTPVMDFYRHLGFEDVASVVMQKWLKQPD